MSVSIEQGKAGKNDVKVVYKEPDTRVEWRKGHDTKVEWGKDYDIRSGMGKGLL